jgi:hypothetical protein
VDRRQSRELELIDRPQWPGDLHGYDPAVADYRLSESMVVTVSDGVDRRDRADGRETLVVANRGVLVLSSRVRMHTDTMTYTDHRPTETRRG